MNACKARRLVLGIKDAIKVCKYSILEKIKPTPMPSPPPYGRKITWCIFLGQGWAGFSYWIFLHSKYTVSNITLSHGLLRKEGIGSRGSQNHQVTFPSPTLKASCCFCPGLANPPPLPLFFPIPPSPLQTLGKNEEKHTNQEGFSLHCVFQLDLNRRRSIQPSLTLPPLFFSRVLFVLFLSRSVSSGLGKSSSLPAAGGDEQHQLPAANTT